MHSTTIQFSLVRRAGKREREGRKAEERQGEQKKCVYVCEREREREKGEKEWEGEKKQGGGELEKGERDRENRERDRRESNIKENKLWIRADAGQ